MSQTNSHPTDIVNVFPFSTLWFWCRCSVILSSNFVCLYLYLEYYLCRLCLARLLNIAVRFVPFGQSGDFISFRNLWINPVVQVTCTVRCRFVLQILVAHRRLHKCSATKKLISKPYVTLPDFPISWTFRETFIMLLMLICYYYYLHYNYL